MSEHVSDLSVSDLLYTAIVLQFSEPLMVVVTG
jgi:hypothetical protein